MNKFLAILSILSFFSKVAVGGGTILYGGSLGEYAECVEITADGGYILGGLTSSFGVGCADIFVVRLATSGEIVWAKTYSDYDSAGTEVVYSIRQTQDGGYIAVGGAGALASGAMIMKLNSFGEIEWAKSYYGVGEAVQILFSKPWMVNI